MEKAWFILIKSTIFRERLGMTKLMLKHFPCDIVDHPDAKDRMGQGIFHLCCQSNGDLELITYLLTRKHDC